MVSGPLLSQGCASRHLRVAVVQEQLKATLVHALRLAGRERLADEPAQALAERVVEPLDVVGLAAALAEGDVLALRRCLLGRLPEVGESQRMTFWLRQWRRRGRGGGAVTGQGVFLPVRLMRTKPPTSIRMPTMLIRVPTAL